MPPNWGGYRNVSKPVNVGYMDTTKPRDPYNVAIAAVLSKQFEKLDYGHARLARQAGISRNSTYLYLDGTRSIPVEKLRNICIALGLPIGKVVDDAERILEQ